MAGVSMITPTQRQWLRGNCDQTHQYIVHIKKLHAIACLSLLPLVFDFKGEDAGGNTIQYVLTTLTLVGGAWFLTQTKLLRAIGLPRKLMVWSAAWTLAGSLLVFLANGVPFGNYGRLILGWVLFALGLYVASRLTHREDHTFVHRTLFVGCLLSTLFTLAFGLTTANVDLGQIRYQILSPVILMFEAMLLHSIIVLRRRSLISIALLVVCLTLQFISITRSQLLAFAIIAIAAFWLRSASVSRSIHSTLRFSLPIAVLMFVTILVAGLVVPELGDRWALRIFETHDAGAVDPTTLSRIAEITDQLNQWGSSGWSMLFGKGYGAEYKWADTYTRDLIGVFNIEQLRAIQAFAAGHNYWVHSLFSGGVIFGAPLPAAILLSTFLAMRRAHRFNRFIGTTPMNIAFTRATLMSVAFLAQTIGGNPFGPRYSALMFGVSVGIMVASYGFLSREIRAIPNTQQSLRRVTAPIGLGQPRSSRA